MADISVIRHQDIINPSVHNPQITLIGCGAIGSRIFMSLIELGMTRIRCFDFDRVEPHNLANQAFTAANIGMPKVVALDDLYTLKTGQSPPASMEFINDRVPNGITPPAGVVFLAVDSFDARRQIAPALASCYYVIDTRMASTHGDVYCFTPGVLTENWLNTLGSDEGGEVSVCGTSISVGPTAALIANLAVWQFINYMTCPAATDKSVHAFFKPLAITTGSAI